MEDISSNWTFKIIVLINYILIQLVGNVFTFSTIYYERWGGDPQKRALSNQLTSFCFVNVAFASIVNYSIYLTRTMVGPLGWFWASFFMCSRAVLSVSSAMAGFQIVFHRCLQLYYWTTAAKLNDDWWAMFLVLFDVMLSILFGMYRLFKRQFESKQVFIFLSGLEPKQPGQTSISPFTIVIYIVGLVSVLSAVVLIIRKKIIESKRDREQAGGQIGIAVISGPAPLAVAPLANSNPINVINNVESNRALGSASQYVLVVVVMLALNLPTLILNNYSYQLGWISILLRDLPLQFAVGFFVPCLFFHWRPEIKAHMVKALWDHAPDCIQDFNPDFVVPFEP